MNSRTSISQSVGDGWEIVADWLPNDVQVSTLAAIDSFSDYGNRYRDLRFIVYVALASANPGAFQIDHTEDPTGVRVQDLNSPEAIPEVPCAAGKEAGRTFYGISALGWRVSAYSSANGNPAILVNRRVLGRRFT